MHVVLISSYEMGRQPFGLASPAAWLRRAGATVTCVDLSRDRLPAEAVRAADLVAFHLPMHTATRMAANVAAKVLRLNPGVHLCFYGLYAPVNAEYLSRLGDTVTILGAEFEADLVALVSGARPDSSAALPRLQFVTPDRSGLPELSRYARLHMADGSHRVAGYTEASRGCTHLCRHCPVVPVYQGAFRIVQREVVLDDIAHQVDAGAEHIVFGDPDFFNGPTHGLAIVEEMHRRFPDLSYDVTIKIEHLRQEAAHLPTLRDTGCLFVTSAVESVDNAILARLDKGHSRADFLRVVEQFREIGLTLDPTFLPFTPWTTLDGYCDLLDLLAEQALVNHVAPIQLAIRLLIPAGSRLLELPETAAFIGAFDEAALVYPWRNPDSRVDRLAARAQEIVAGSVQQRLSRAEVFMLLRSAAYDAIGRSPNATPVFARTEVPFLNEPWYC